MAENSTNNRQFNINYKKCHLLCRFCKSKNIKKNGRRKNKNRTIQTYYCKDCKKRFRTDNGFLKMKNRPKVVSTALDLYASGMSFRKIQNHLERIHKVKISHQTIYDWIKKYTPKLKKITDNISSLLPLGTGWHGDEMMLRVGGKHVWMWNGIDALTRFKLPSLISLLRREEDAKLFFSQIKEAHGRQFNKFITDGLPAYYKSFRKIFWRRNPPCPEHISCVSFISKANNNIMERFQGNVRERVKVMRGFQHEEGAKMFNDFYSTFYNFIRPHLGLGGKTPAEVAGFDYLDGDRFLELIELNAFLMENVKFQALEELNDCLKEKSLF